MEKKAVAILLAWILVASLAGCGTKTEATDQEVSESESEEIETDESTGGEVVGGDTEELKNEEYSEAEGDIIEFEDEKGTQDAPELVGMVFEPYEGTIDATDKYVPVFDEEGYFVGRIRMGFTVDTTAMGNGWVQFENPVEGTEYDYLYAGAYCLVPNEMSATEMAQKIQDYINTYGFADIDIDYTFATEKTSDMEVYEFRMDSVYDDETMLDYWLNQNLSLEKTDVFYYETLYVECEEDTDGWIICRIYHKDKVDLGY